MDEFNTLESSHLSPLSHLSPHHHCRFHQYHNLPPPPPLYQVGPAGAGGRDERIIQTLQTTSCPKHGQKQVVEEAEAPLEKIKPISQVSGKTKQLDTKEILKILRERAICIVSSFLGLLSG